MFKRLIKAFDNLLYKNCPKCNSNVRKRLRKADGHGGLNIWSCNDEWHQEHGSWKW